MIIEMYHKILYHDKLKTYIIKSMALKWMIKECNYMCSHESVGVDWARMFNCKIILFIVPIILFYH